MLCERRERNTDECMRTTTEEAKMAEEAMKADKISH